MVLEVSHPSEPERMLQEYSEAATESTSGREMSSAMKGRGT